MGGWGNEESFSDYTALCYLLVNPFFKSGHHTWIRFGCAREACFSRHPSAPLAPRPEVRPNAEERRDDEHSAAVVRQHSGFQENEQVNIIEN